jgi:hypothetical protein
MPRDDAPPPDLHDAIEAASARGLDAERAEDLFDRAQQAAVEGRLARVEPGLAARLRAAAPA